MRDVESLKPWLGRRQDQHDDVSSVLATRMAALLDRSAMFRAGDALPMHWYPILFGETAPQSSLAQDGHPEKGDFLPPIPLPKRMFAGKRVEFIAPLRIGERVRKTSVIHAITPKTGRSGPMCFVTVRHEIVGETGLAVVEEQDIVYKAASRTAAHSSRAPHHRDVHADARQKGKLLGRPRIITPDAMMLFRYSAITFNAHRIHYDLEYARNQEDYPALVVNGGLTLLLIWQYAADNDWMMTHSASRNLRPLYVDQPLALHAEQRKGGKVIVATDPDGNTAVEAAITERNA
jgi:3-methylfumaryl-CoA hydratase